MATGLRLFCWSVTSGSGARAPLSTLFRAEAAAQNRARYPRDSLYSVFCSKPWRQRSERFREFVGKFKYKNVVSSTKWNNFVYPLYPQVLMYDHEHSIIIISMNIMVLHFLAAQGTAQESTFLYIPIMCTRMGWCPRTEGSERDSGTQKNHFSKSF